MAKNNTKSSRPRLQSIGHRVATLETKRGCNAIVRIVGRELQRIRDRILLRDEYTCQHCGRVSTQGEVDHIVPLHLGGSAKSEMNMQYLCKDCHERKTKREEKERGNGTS